MVSSVGRRGRRGEAGSDEIPATQAPT